MSKSGTTFRSAGGVTRINPARLRGADALGLKLAQSVVAAEVHNELSKFNHTSNGVHAWRAYGLARSVGLPIHADVLAYLDKCASAATQGGSPREVVVGMQLSNNRGGTRKQRASSITDRQHMQVQALEMAYKNCGKRGKTAARRTLAEQFDTTEGALHQLWMKAARVKKL